MNKTLLILATATLALGALPASASAKVRGCDYRLRGITEAELVLADAHKRNIGILEARAQLARARDAAAEEGCFVEARRDARIEKARWDGDHDRRDHRWEERRQARARYDYLLNAGFRRGLSRREFTELWELREQFRF